MGERCKPGSYPLGEAIRRARVAKGMSLRGLADRLGLSAPFLSDLEHGRRNTNRLPEIAKAVGISLKELRRLESRVDRELKAWIEANPEVVAMLRELRDKQRRRW